MPVAFQSNSPFEKTPIKVSKSKTTQDIQSNCSNERFKMKEMKNELNKLERF